MGAKAISSGVIPIVNEPYVVMTNGNNDVFYNYQVSNGSWAGWSVVGAGVGALSVSTGVIQASLSPAIYEPYVFMINGLNDVYFKVRNTNGSWSGWSPVGVGVGAAAISAITLRNQPLVSMQNGAGDIFLNGEKSEWIVAGLGRLSGQVRHPVRLSPCRRLCPIPASTNLRLTGAGQVYSSYGIYLHWNPWIGLGSLATGVVAPSHCPYRQTPPPLRSPSRSVPTATFIGVTSRAGRPGAPGPASVLRRRSPFSTRLPADCRSTGDPPCGLSSCVERRNPAHVFAIAGEEKQTRHAPVLTRNVPCFHPLTGRSR